jgi:molybdopterin molybdotransferase
MSGLLTVSAALDLVLKDARLTNSEMVALEDSAGRVLARDLAANRTQPPFPASAMDGYAVRASDVCSCPVDLHLIGESAAGHGYEGTVVTGQCVRIFTGAPVPAGADAIVIQENVGANGSFVTVLESVDAGRYVRPAGLDFVEGDILLRAGCLLTSATISLAAAMNHPKLPVHRKPLVAVIATGDELVLPGQTPTNDQIIASNGFGVSDIIRQAGGDVLDIGIATDTLGSLREKFVEAEEADVVVTLGGASVGDHDLVARALQDRGIDLNFWKLAMRPGKPVMFGVASQSARQTRYLGLPGNPVSSLVCAHIFLAPLVRKMTGRSSKIPRFAAVVAKDIGPNDQREEYMRATHEDRDGTFHVCPFDNQDSSVLSLMAKATCLMIRPAFAPTALVGSACEIILL